MGSAAGQEFAAATLNSFRRISCRTALLIAAVFTGTPHESRAQILSDAGNITQSASDVDRSVQTSAARADFAPRDIKATKLYSRIKAALDDVRAIDTHDHLRAFDQIPGRVTTTSGYGMTLYSLWSHSYLTRTTRISPWPADGSFDTWWREAHDDFDNVRATSFYRYLRPAFRDLYSVEFDTITSAQARRLNDQIYANYETDEWLRRVITRRANIELMFIDPYWNRLQFAREYRFAVPVLNVTTIMRGSHPDRYASASDSPFAYAQRKEMPTTSFDDFLAVVDELFVDAVAADTVCLKSTQAYQRTLQYEQVTKETGVSGLRQVFAGHDSVAAEAV